MTIPRTILIIDDDHGLREVLSLSLSMEGFTILTASNGMVALSLLEKCERPSLILLDIRMPIMDGHQFLEKFRKIDSLNTIPVFVMSADAQDSTIDGATAFIEKPYIFETLLQLINRS